MYSHRNLKDLCLRASEIVCSRLQSCLASDSSIKLCWFTIVRTFLPVSYIFNIQSMMPLNPSYWTAGVQLHAPQGDRCSMGGLGAAPKLSSCWYISPGSGSPLQALGPILKYSLKVLVTRIKQLPHDPAACWISVLLDEIHRHGNFHCVPESGSCAGKWRVPRGPTTSFGAGTKWPGLCLPILWKMHLCALVTSGLISSFSHFSPL